MSNSPAPAGDAGVGTQVTKKMTWHVAKCLNRSNHRRPNGFVQCCLVDFQRGWSVLEGPP